MEKALNLKLYLGCVSSVSSLTPADLSTVLTGLTGATAAVATYNVDISQSTSLANVVQLSCTRYRTGTHIAAVWEDEADQPKLNWFIGEFNKHSENSLLSIFIKNNQIFCYSK